MRDQFRKQVFGDEEFKISFLVDVAAVGTPPMHWVTGLYPVDCRLGVYRQEFVLIHVNKNFLDSI